MVALQQPIDILGAIRGTYLPVLQRQFVLIAGVLLAVVVAIRSRSAILGAAALCALRSGGVGLALGVKIGAGENYFLLFTVFAVLAGGLLALRKNAAQIDTGIVGTPVDNTAHRLSLIAVVLLYAGTQAGGIWSQVNNARNDRTEEFRSLQQVLQAIPDPKAAILELDGNLPIVAPDRVVLATSDVVSWVAAGKLLPNGSLEAALRQHHICWAVVARDIYDAMAKDAAPPFLASIQMAYLRQVRALFTDSVILPNRVLMRAKDCDRP